MLSVFAGGVLTGLAVSRATAQDDTSSVSLAELPTGVSSATLYLSYFYGGFMILFGLITYKGSWTFPVAVAPLVGKTEEEVIAWSDGCMDLPNGKDLYGMYTLLARIEHTCWTALGVSVFYAAFFVDFKQAFMAYFAAGLSWLLAAFTHWQAVLLPRKHVYGIGLSKALAFVDPVMAAIGIYLCIASKKA